MNKFCLSSIVAQDNVCCVHCRSKLDLVFLCIYVLIFLLMKDYRVSLGHVLQLRHTEIACL